MENDIYTYMANLEALAFFSAYPIIYALLHFARINGRSNTIVEESISLLPYSYAFIATMYLGLQLRNLSPAFSLVQIENDILFLNVRLWGLVAISFWFPIFSQKTIYSFFHSVIFYFLILRDIYDQVFYSEGLEKIKNDMAMFINSLILNISAITAVFLIYYLIKIYKKRHIYSSGKLF